MLHQAFWSTEYIIECMDFKFAAVARP